MARTTAPNAAIDYTEFVYSVCLNERDEEERHPADVLLQTLQLVFSIAYVIQSLMILLNF